MSKLNVHVVSCDTTASGGEVIVGARTIRKSLILRNEGTATVYVGSNPDPDGTALTTSTGFPLADGESLDFSDYTGSLYGVVAAGSADVRVLEVYA